MTTHLVKQERPCRRAPASAEEPRGREGTRSALEMSIERRPDPDSPTLSEADAVWPQRLRRIVRASLVHWGRPALVEPAQLLLTELATNALRHASGLDIGVRVYLQGDRLMIQVNDGSPICPALRRAKHDDEGGRGLCLVDAMSESWGVSPDGTTTWCTLPLTAEGSPQMQPVATTAPALRALPMELPPGPTAVNLARLKGRTLLTVLGWPGNHHAAIDVIHCLVDNAVRYGLLPKSDRLHLRLSVTEAHELLIDVTDSNPTFPDFDKAIAGELGRGLWDSTQHGAVLTWWVTPELNGKTVRATMRPGQAEL